MSSQTAPSDRVYIADLDQPPQRIAGVFTIVNAQMGMTRTEKPYLRCLLRDRSGEMPARMWSIDEVTFRALPTDGFVFVKGETQAYQGEIQLIIHAIEPHEPSQDELRHLIASSARDPGEMLEELTGVLATLKHPAMKALAETYLADEHLMEAFKRAPAAKQMHHAYLGGLLEHTLNLMKVADAVCPLYPKINRDIVLMGLFLHDLGKTRELGYDGPFTYTDRGELVGHIVEGAIMLHDKAQQMMTSTGTRLPAGVLTVLQHIILSHHGIPEYGAAKIPMTPEALLVSMLDDIDAKMAISLEATRPDTPGKLDRGGNFTDKNWALGAKLYRPDPLAE